MTDTKEIKDYKDLFDTIDKESYCFRAKNPQVIKFKLNREIMVRDENDQPTGIIIPSPDMRYSQMAKKQVPWPWEWPNTVEFSLEPTSDLNKHTILYLLHSPQNASHPLYKGSGKAVSSTFFFLQDKEKEAVDLFNRMADKQSVYSVMEDKIASTSNGKFDIKSDRMLRAFAHQFGIDVYGNRPQTVILSDLIGMIDQDPSRAKSIVDSQDTIPSYYIDIMVKAGVLRMKNKTYYWKATPISQPEKLMARKPLISVIQDPSGSGNLEALLKLERAYFSHTNLEIDLIQRDLNPNLAMSVSESVEEPNS